MRCLVLTAAYPGPTEPERAIFLENLHRGLLAAAGGRLELAVVAPRVHVADPLLEERHGIAVHRFRYPSGGRRLKEAARIPWGALALYFVSGLRRTLEVGSRRRWDVLLAHWVLPAGVIAAAAARMLGLPLVLYAHGSDVNRYARRFPGDLLARACLRGARRVVAVSRELAQLLRRELDVPEERIDVLPMGVGPDFTPGERDRRVERDALGLGGFLELLYVGDVTREKGVEELAAALRLLWRDGTRARLHVVGEGPLAGELAALSGAGGNSGASVPREAVRYLGRLPPADVARWYRGADLYVHASRSEGTPVAVLEALSSGCPVVSTAVGGVPDVVRDGVTGLLVPPRDPEALAAAIGSLEREGRVEAMRERLRVEPPDHAVETRARRLLARLAGEVDDALD